MSAASHGSAERLNGPQTTGRAYRNLSAPELGTHQENNLHVPMRDGVDLLADVIRPATRGRFPALVAASPYPRQIQNSSIPLGFVEAGTSAFFVARGYAHVIANVRGTGGSGGTYSLFGAIDRGDMYDLVEWAAAQPWCDGNVGMIGISAFAIAQLQAAVAAPPHLKAIFPLATTADLYEAIYHGGLLNATFIGAWLRGVGILANVADGVLRGAVVRLAERVFKSPAVHKRLQHVNGEAALSILGKVMPARAPAHPWNDLYRAAVVEHQTKDAFWQERDLQPLLASVRVPVYLGCDWENVPLHLPSTFRALEALPEEPTVRGALMEPGGLTWPWESFHVEALAWFDHWLKDRDTGVLDGPRIRYQLPGAGSDWHASDTWPPASVRHVPLHLQANGVLSTDPGVDASRSYVYLPASMPRRPSGEEDELPAVLTWETSPFSGDLDVAGPIELALDAASSASDTAWLVTVQDVAPDGPVTNVTGGWLRASLRGLDEERSRPGRPVHRLDRPELVSPGADIAYRVALVDTARRFAAGHRLRVVLRSDDSTGEPVLMGFRHASLGLASRNTVYASSRLLIPVLDGLGALAKEAS